MYTPYESNTLKRFLKYIFWIIIVLRILSGFIIGYFYLRSTGSQTNQKGGTFIEWIFGQISYLPYLKNDDQSVFYQNLLFRNCLNPYEKTENGKLANDLCKVYTEDDKNYVLKIIDEDATWSDGVPVTIDDVFFTYDEIIRQNKWWIDTLNTRKTITVALENGKVKVEFPTENKENILLFTNAILPKHYLQNTTLEDYRTTFALDPVKNGCAKIVPQNTDVNSLIFDVNQCKNTNFSYYQIKSYQDFDTFQNNKGSEIIDLYESPYELRGYESKNVLTSKLSWIFFNTNSEKLKVRLRRSLGWLIHHHFYTGDYQDYIQKYDGIFLNTYTSKGENVKEFMNRMSLTDTGISTTDLQDSGAKELPWSISINGVDRKFIFFMQKPKEARNLEINFSNEFTGIIITAPDGTKFSPKGYNSKDKKVIYKLSPDNNIKIWSNQYTIDGTIKGKTYTIASIDIYVFENYAKTNEENNWKLNVLYYGDEISTYVVKQLKSIFEKAEILDNFVFEEVFTPEELEGKLLIGSYDIYIGTVDLWAKSDILSIFWTEESLINPSKYRNPFLTSYIKQYQKEANEKVREQINALLAQDMPLIILGNTYSSVKIKNKIAETIFSGEDVLQSNLWRYQIYHNYAIIKSVHVNWKTALKRENLSAFFQKKWTDVQKMRKKEEKSDLFEGLIQGTGSIETSWGTWENLEQENSTEEEPKEEEIQIQEKNEEQGETGTIKTLEELVSFN